MFTVDVVTGSRAEYGLLRPVLQNMLGRQDLQPRLVVTGAHLSAAHGNTISEIEADGFPVAARLDILSAPVPGGRQATARRTALALQLFLDYFTAASPAPDALLLLGDRYEVFAAAQAAALLAIPVAHISGGDVTAGADDDWFRHCITKMARLHFPSCEVYRRRLLRMGEDPEFVFNVGGLGDENIRHMQLLSHKQLAEELDIPLPQPYALVTFHPETATGALLPEQQVAKLLQALAQYPQLFLLFTGSNADAGGDVVTAQIQQFCAQRQNAALFSSLGTRRYLAAMKHAALVVGNSSSGVVETPSLGTPAIDIGARQAGRVTGDNVLHCKLESAAIAAAIEAALSPSFASRARAAQSPYNGGATSEKIVSILSLFLHTDALRQPKLFYDGGPAE